MPTPQIRKTAKGFISTSPTELVFVAGKRGMFNLPGGGIKTSHPDIPGSFNETHRAAFYREVFEEVGIAPDVLGDVEEKFTIEGLTTSAQNVTRVARWRLFQGGNIVPAQALSIPERSDITDIAIMTPSECLAHENMSELAKRSVSYALQNNLL